ncbi:hypothetical protein F0562_014519 [Nyssa sinensis]|uniref:Uncharacterized protein n=1 Tax=Nyssa sinensis TaxID=561372 RepID=A0A5J4ZN09_9ASTE|nr:hypothetical protein F0562_014519 [Nyssa sinensis]
MIEDSPQVSIEDVEGIQPEAEHREAIPEISFHAITGTQHPQTIRVLGKLKNKNVMVLIDGGSTHNFIDQATISKFGLPVIQDKKFQVMVANQEKIECVGQCQALTVTIQGHSVIADYYILPVAACQLVLGVQWLETLGPIETDYKQLTMTFKVEGISHTFQGLGRADIAALTNKEFNGLQGTGYFFQIILSNDSSQLNSYPPEIGRLLKAFSHVFEPPTRLPPRRSQDHQIPLQPNTGPVSVRPYRYPYYQKTEIEQMVMSTRCSNNDDEAERCRELVKESFKIGAKFCFGDLLGPLKWLGFWLYGKQAVEVTRRYDDLLERILKEHEEERENGEREDKDLMDILLEVYHDDKAEVKITRTHIKAFFLVLIPQQQAMQWTIAELVNHPHVFQKVREEIELVVGKSRLVEESDIPSLPYLQAVVKETLRLYPPGPVTTRECRQHCKIQGFDIPEKTAVAINLYAIMRDPELWDDPDEFRPERFVVSSKEQEHLDHENEAKGQSFNFVPFGAGRRGCPGTLVAFSLMNSAVAAMVQCFDWKVGRDGDGAKVDMESGIGMSLGMAHPLVLLPVLHFNPFA